MKLKPQVRLLQVKDAVVDRESRTVTFPFSSEYVVPRYYGDEILSHDKAAVRLDRLNGGAQLIFNHNPDDVLGVVELAKLDGKRGVATVRFARSARGDEMMDGVDDKIYRNVSMMYRIYKVEEDVKKGQFRITDWEPFEISIVSIPADPTVGIGRGATLDELDVEVTRIDAEQPEQTPAAVAAVNIAAAQASAQPAPIAETRGAIAMENTTAAAPEKTAAELDALRVQAIRTLCKANQLDERVAVNWAQRGLSIEAVADELLALMEARGKLGAQSPAALGMEKKDVERWSLHRAIQAMESGDWSKAGLEHTTSQEVQKRTGRSPSTGRSILIPIDILSRQMRVTDDYRALMQRMGMDQRDLTAALASAGGYLVGTENQGFIDLLRNASVCYAMGARRLSGLQGNVTIPKRTAGATGYWLLNESQSITESGQTFGQIALTPKTCGAYNEISRQLIMQSSPSAEDITMSGLALDVAIAVDLAGLKGTGANGQPLGLFSTPGIGNVADAAVDYGDIIEFQTDVASANALNGASSAGYVMAPATAGLLKQRVKFSNTASPIWEGKLDRGQVDGYPGMSSNQLASEIAFGDWSQMIMAEWGVLEVALNPNANFPAGIIGIRAFYTVDMAARYAAAFSVMNTAT